MKITRDEVAHVAQLARLKLGEDQTERLTGQLNDILESMEKLNQLDTSGVPSTNHALELTGAMREDVVKPSLERERALANAPDSNGEAFVVPRVI
jgi:aspartyl-tRNA(Asn)/glutamyl-tRNA(Gln) amidotransferase subunit C